MPTVLADLTFDGSRFAEGPQRLDLEGGVIARFERMPDDSPPLRDDDAGLVDARGLCVMPGLVNAHAHIARGGAFDVQEPPRPFQAAESFLGALGSGTTTLADLGCPPRLIAALRRHTRADPAAGPDLVCAGPVLTAPGGYPLDWMPSWVARLGAAIACGDERDAGRAVERVARAGMDCVKLAVMHQSYAERPLPAVDVPTASAVVREAHRLGLRVLAHAHSNADYRVALAAGVDGLMHSSFEPLDDELVVLVRAAGAVVCPTLWVFESICALDDERPAWPRYDRFTVPGVRRALRRWVEAYRASREVVPDGIAGGLPKTRVAEAVRAAAANLRLLHDAGVPIAFGNDASYGLSLVARPVDELAAMQRAGLTPATVLAAATSGAASVLGLSDRGGLAPGLRADVIAVDRAVVHDVTAIERVAWVVARGERVAPPAERTRLRRGLATAYARGLAATPLELFER